MIAKIADKVIKSFKCLDHSVTKTGKSGNAAKTYLGIDENEPEKVGTKSAKNIKTQ